MAHKNILTCPECKDNIIKSHNSEVKLRAKILKWNRDGMFAVCKSCGHEVAVMPDVLKSIQTTFQYVIEKQACTDI